MVRVYKNSLLRLTVRPPRAVQEFRAALARLLQDSSRLGPKLQELESRGVGRLFVGEYELRYEIIRGPIIVVRLWHAREDR